MVNEILKSAYEPVLGKYGSLNPMLKGHYLNASFDRDEEACWKFSALIF